MGLEATKEVLLAVVFMAMMIVTFSVFIIYTIAVLLAPTV